MSEIREYAPTDAVVMLLGNKVSLLNQYQIILKNCIVVYETVNTSLSNAVFYWIYWDLLNLCGPVSRNGEGVGVVYKT